MHTPANDFEPVLIPLLELLVRHNGYVRLPQPLSGGSDARLGALARLAAAAGERPPETFKPHAAQLFFRDLAVEEIRLCGETTDGTCWHTTERPRLAIGEDGTIQLAPEDAGRRHISVQFLREPGREDLTLALAWDMEIPLALPPRAWGSLPAIPA